jgi:phosphatidylserine/phosphatidylglycerophosphate/cardiolipin synthase-like enzyme
MANSEVATVQRQFSEETVILSPAERRETLLQALRAARKRVVLSLFRCDDSKMVDELAEALERGVRVEVLVTQKAKGWEKKLKDLRFLLESLGAQVYRYAGDRAKYHAKYLVVDDAVAVVASLNFTHKCFRDTCDFLLVTPDAGVVESLEKLFEADRKAPESRFPNGLTDRLIVGPDHARERIAALLAGAQKQIRIIDHRITDPRMLELLQEKAGAGVQVETLGRGQISGMRSHGKMMVIDGQVALLGSISLSPPSLNNRREVAVLVRDPNGVRRLDEFFSQQLEQHLPSQPGGAEDDEDEEEEGEE